MASCERGAYRSPDKCDQRRKACKRHGRSEVPPRSAREKDTGNSSKVDMSSGRLVDARIGWQDNVRRKRGLCGTDLAGR